VTPKFTSGAHIYIVAVHLKDHFYFSLILAFSLLTLAVMFVTPYAISRIISKN